VRFLIAEDDAGTRKLLSIALTLADHEVLLAENGAEAVEMAECNQPDVVLMDVRMPKMNGFEALAALKAKPATASIPVVLMSGAYVRRADIERGKELGAVNYLKKPLAVLSLGKILEGHAKKWSGMDPDHVTPISTTNRKESIL